MLHREATREGYAFLDRLAAEFGEGIYATDDDLPVLLAAFADGELAAVGGLTADPYDPAPDLARLRHVYVRPGARGTGVGRVLAVTLVEQGLALAGRLSLRAADARAAGFWEAIGFARVDDSESRTHLLMR